MASERTPGIKLLFVALIGAALVIPLLMVYGLVSDRQHQSRIAQQSITAGWGGDQVLSGPVLVIPYEVERVQTEVVDGRNTTRSIKVREELFLSPEQQKLSTDLEPEKRTRSIYETVTYLATNTGSARFALPADLERSGVSRDRLLLGEAELRFGASDPRGLQSDAKATVGGKAVALKPGNGVAASGGSGFHGFVDWAADAPLDVAYSYSLRGSRSVSLVPRGGVTEWTVKSPWPHPGFGGSFLPERKDIGTGGFEATWSVANLALGQSLVMKADPGPPILMDEMIELAPPAPVERAAAPSGPSMAASIALVEPVDLYSRVDRAVKYGFLFIGFTFLAFFMFDIVGGARVAAAEYLLTGAGLVLFFVLLLAFAEVIGFMLAYLVASAAIIGLLTAYSAAVLGSWLRARVIGALLVGLYALLYVLLNLEAWSLLIGAVLLFFALAGTMYATRRIDWSSVGRRAESEEQALT